MLTQPFGWMRRAVYVSGRILFITDPGKLVFYLALIYPLQNDTGEEICLTSASHVPRSNVNVVAIVMDQKHTPRTVTWRPLSCRLLKHDQFLRRV
jgi:hypothetical protein